MTLIYIHPPHHLTSVTPILQEEKEGGGGGKKFTSTTDLLIQDPGNGTWELICFNV